MMVKKIKERTFFNNRGQAFRTTNDFSVRDHEGALGYVDSVVYRTTHTPKGGQEIVLNSDPEITKAVFIRGERMPLSVAVEMYPSEGYLAYLHTISPEAFVIKAEVDGDPLFYLDGDKASYEPLED